MEYYRYFRLEGPPFQPASPYTAVYFSATHLQGLATLESGLVSDLSGLTLLTGEAGSGKTTLIYALLQRDHKRVRIAHIDDPKLPFIEMLKAIVSQFNLYSPGETKLDYVNVLVHLLDLHGQEERIAIVVDEAQTLSDDTLEELRLLSNRGQRADRCLQLILVGQPELAERLKKPELRQLNQRISSRGTLKPLNNADATMYVECRLSAQGGQISDIFERGALNHLLRRSDGIPRKINMLCYNAMVAAFQDNERKVSAGTAKRIAAEYSDLVSIKHRKPLLRYLEKPALGLLGVLALLLLVGLFYPNVASEWIAESALSVGTAIAHRVAPHRNEAKGPVPLTPAERAALKRHLQEAAARPKAAAPPAPQPAAEPTSLAPPAAPPAPPKVAVAPPAPAHEEHWVAPGPTAAEVSAREGAPQPDTVPAASAQGNQIVVRQGDTLEQIAVRYFGTTAGLSRLIKANPQLHDINRLSVGEIINLPPGVTPKAVHTASATAPSSATAPPAADNPPE
jgi:general secretion pathway protein A